MTKGFSSSSAPTPPEPKAYAFDFLNSQSYHDYIYLSQILQTNDLPAPRLDNVVNPTSNGTGAHGTAYDDIIVAGTSGTDRRVILWGGKGNDQLYAGAETSLADATAQGETGSASHNGFVFMDGYEGDDQVIGAADDDILFGGKVSDTITGGGGQTGRGNELFWQHGVSWTSHRPPHRPDGRCLYRKQLLPR